jgi:hypothetical protein
MTPSIDSAIQHDHTTESCSANIDGLNNCRMDDQCQNLDTSEIQVSGMKKRRMKQTL